MYEGGGVDEAREQVDRFSRVLVVLGDVEW